MPISGNVGGAIRTALLWILLFSPLLVILHIQHLPDACFWACIPDGEEAVFSNMGSSQ